MEETRKRSLRAVRLTERLGPSWLCVMCHILQSVATLALQDWNTEELTDRGGDGSHQLLRGTTVDDPPGAPTHHRGISANTPQPRYSRV